MLSLSWQAVSTAELSVEDIRRFGNFEFIYKQIYIL